MHTFHNGQTLVVCGFEAKGFLSEFEVIACNSQKVLSSYDATENCRSTFQNDTLTITQFKYLPTGEFWGWQFVSISQEQFTAAHDTLLHIPIQPAFQTLKIEVPQNKQDRFLDDIIVNKDNGLHHDWAWEEIIAQLEVLALNGNTKAKDILFDLEELTNYPLDGGLKEQYRDAIALVQWVQGE
ncbi:MAG: hypothetical protein N4A46_05920 [Schleiferiaceae bacterium]|jgi:hypothetical protein|nr:hypothetical protein [Schleiferiaceae bacterium]